MEYSYEIEEIREILANGKNVVFFGGAGVSTESGIPDFRGKGGLYDDAGESKEYYLSSECLHNEPAKFFRFFRENMVFTYAEPNDAHYALAELEQRGILKAVITQNIDGLHQKAGSKRVIELHGSADRHYCSHCRKRYTTAQVEEWGSVPYCPACGGVIRPDVVLYGEALPGFSYAEAEDAVAEADVMIVGGSSLVVHPAASLVDFFQGEHLVIINHTPTPYDGLAEYVIRESVGKVLRTLVDEL